MQYSISWRPRDGFTLLPVKIRLFVRHCNGNSKVLTVLQQPSKPDSRASNVSLTFQKKFTVFLLLKDATDRNTETILPVSSRDKRFREMQLISSDVATANMASLRANHA